MKKRGKQGSTNHPTVVNCAIYTRKSTEEGLDQEFNSLDAQREAAEAYIKSQQNEGWVCLSEYYDDGGFSGGNMERPGLQRLMADCKAGIINCIVVYKVDRLTRSLLDFTKIMETLDGHGVSFVSVTQQFNTTHSMGRLTLNILLSFAQFEREIIGERTRDKMAASRRKGKWVGGTPVLGYDIHPEGGRLVVNDEEAERVVQIFHVYLERKSLVSALQELNNRGWRTKQWTSRGGVEHGGKPFDRANLHRLLSNVTYQGEVRYRGEVYDGEHDGIVPADLWNAAQKLLSRNGRNGGSGHRNRHGALLRDLLYCDPCGRKMSHAYTTRANKRYRYYVCQKAQKEGWSTCPSKSVPAGEIENFVVDQIRGIGKDRGLLEETFKQAELQGREEIQQLEKEQRRLEGEVKKNSASISKLMATVGRNGEKETPHTQRLADLHDRMQRAENRLRDVVGEVGVAHRQQIDFQGMEGVFGKFDPVWDALTPREKCRVLNLLVERVGYDGGEENVAITFRPTGIKQLAGEWGEEGAE